MLDRPFFQRDPLTCARELIGCELVWHGCAGIIVETEAYFALGDEACHTFARPSARAFVERHEAGAAYVYFNYGMYWLLNVLVKGGAHDGFVLFRAIEPTRGIDAMKQRRESNLKAEPGGASQTAAGSPQGEARTPKQIKNLKPTALCSGPGKLTIALGVAGADHGRDFCSGKDVGFCAPAQPAAVDSDVRIGISKAAHWPWRFLLRGSPFVSAKAKGQTAREGRPGLENGTRRKR